MGSEKFCLRWNDFETNISVAFRELRDDKDFFDVTLACDDEQIQAHKVILSACSPFFRNVLRRNPHQHPLLYLKGVKYTDLQSVLNFMYHGEVNVAQEELNSFLAVAEDLRVKGLTQNQSGGSSSRTNSTPKAQELPKARPPEREPAPPPKRPRPTPPVASYTHDDDDIQEVVPVKTEPREHIPPPAPVEMYHAPSPVVQQVAPPPPQPTHVIAPVQQTQQLQQMDDSLQYAGDESYDDYGQYGAEGGYDAGIVDPGAQDANKGNFSTEELSGTVASPEDFKKYIARNDSGPVCGICYQFSNRSVTNVKNHIESKHFPNLFTYTCKHCEMTFGTNTALEIHTRRTHKNGNMY